MALDLALKRHTPTNTRLFALASNISVCAIQHPFAAPKGYTACQGCYHWIIGDGRTQKIPLYLLVKR